MRKIICALAVLALLPVVADAKKTKTNLDGVDQAAAVARQKAQTPHVNIYRLDNIVSSPEYIAFLKEKTLNIIGDEDSISLEQIKKNGIIEGIAWKDLSSVEQENLTNLAARRGGSLLEIDVIALLVLLDAQLERDADNKEVFHMDAKFSNNEQSGLAQAKEVEILRLIVHLRKFTRRYERMTVQKDQVLQNKYEEMKKIPWYQNGRVNQTELDKLFYFVDAVHDELIKQFLQEGIRVPSSYEIFKEAIKDHLAKIDQDRGGGTSYTFDDGTNLYHNGLRGEHRYTQLRYIPVK